MRSPMLKVMHAWSNAITVLCCAVLYRVYRETHLFLPKAIGVPMILEGASKQTMAQEQAGVSKRANGQTGKRRCTTRRSYQTQRAL